DLAFIAGLRQRALAFCLGLKSTAACWHANEAWTSAIPAPPYLGRGRHRVGVPAKPRIHTVAEIRQGIATDQWRQVAYRDGVDGKPLVREFVALRAHLTNGQQVKDGITPDASDELWLLLERPSGSTDKNGIKQYAISGPDAMSLDELAQISHVRPVIERNSYENAK
ncbi:ISXo8 transposase, partial [mine drainage metagenome]